VARHKSLTQTIKETQRTLAKYEAVIKAFPDARIHETYTPHSFSSKEVNKNYTKLQFTTNYNRLTVMPYSEVEFEFEGNLETVLVHSSPKYNRLAYIPWSRDKEKVIRFSRVAFNLKNNNFKDDMLNDCRVAIMNFIKDNPGHKLDQKHLEPRLKKLILFT
jgi:hypothetical protein